MTPGRTLFGGQNAIGKEVNIETGLYTVIGVLDKQKQPFGGGKNRADNQVYFPFGHFPCNCIPRTRTFGSA